MENKASITALMSSFARAFHFENEKCPVFADTLAKKLMTDEEYKTIEKYILGGIDFFAPEKKKHLYKRYRSGTIYCQLSACSHSALPYSILRACNENSDDNRHGAIRNSRRRS